MSHKINKIVEGFPELSEHVEMVEFVLDIREAFKLERVPFEVRVGTWSSGSLDKYYKQVEEKRVHKRLQAQKKTKHRGSAGWKRY